MFGGFGIEKIFLLLIVVLLLFGAKRIPEISSSLGRGIREFKRSINDLQNEVHTSDDAPLRPAPPIPRDQPPAPPRPDDTRREPKRLLM
jgi:sec-independent protein translocase protein TatA